MAISRRHRPFGGQDDGPCPASFTDSVTRILISSATVSSPTVLARMADPTYVSQMTQQITYGPTQIEGTLSEERIS